MPTVGQYKRRENITALQRLWLSLKLSLQISASMLDYAQARKTAPANQRDQRDATLG
jgi:hypothetical protein